MNETFYSGEMIAALRHKGQMNIYLCPLCRTFENRRSGAYGALTSSLYHLRYSASCPLAPGGFLTLFL